MLKRVFKLFQIARRLSTSGAVDIINQVHQIPVPINLFFSLISIGAESNRFEINQKPGQKLEPLVYEFIQYALSKEGQQVVIKDGYIPLNKAQVDDVLAQLNK